MTSSARERYIYEIKKCPELGEVLDRLDEVAGIQRQIRAVFGTDDLLELEEMLGDLVEGNEVTIEAIAHAKQVAAAHEELFQRYKELLHQLASGEV